jgi:hypothetical protein
MGYAMTRHTLENVKNQTNDNALQSVAVALMQLSRAIEADFAELDRSRASCISECSARKSLIHPNKKVF